MLRIGFTLILIFSFLTSLIDEPSPPLSPQDELKTFRLAPGHKISLVASEPMVQDPVLIQFDEKGRLWVVEMRSFMPDIDGTGEDQPIGRVSVLEDTNGDFQMDKSTVFADSLVLPRAISFYQDGVLISENIPLWFYQDTNGDGKADKRTLVDSTYGGGGLPEHSANGLILGFDNWLYNAKSKYRYQRQGEQWVKEETEFRGQWGISKDDYGRLYYNYNWSQLHADLVPANYLNRNLNHESTTGIDHGLTIDRRVFPARPNPAINRGYIPGTLDENGKLLEFTSACTPMVLREKGIWADKNYGSVFVCEPAGNLVKQNLVNEQGNYLEATNAFDGFEFLASTDERFRPVYLTTGPDGAIYLADMYRGINQHGAYMTEYLRTQTLERGLDKHIHLGRIWRIVPEKAPDFDYSDLSKVSAFSWVKDLDNPISWYRDQSFRMIVQRNPEGIQSDLETLAVTGSTAGRIAAIWALENTNQSNTALLIKLLDDKEDKIRSLALRLLEKRMTTNSALNQIIEQKVSSYLEEIDSPAFNLQILLSSNAFKQDLAFRSIETILALEGKDPLLRDAALSALSGREMALIKYLLKSRLWQMASDNKEIFMEQLAGIVIKRKNVSEIENLLSLLSSDLNWQKMALLNGAALQSATSDPNVISLNKKPQILSGNLPQVSNLAKGLTWPGKPTLIKDTEEKKALSADAMKQFASGRKSYLTYCAGCHGGNGKGMKRFAPPLAGSEWVTGQDSRLALILLHGIEGPITVNSQHYDVPDILPVMPSHSTLPDEDIANIMTYIRNEWGHNAEPVSRRTVGMLRIKSQGKVQPWTAAELNKHVESLKEN